MSMYQPELDDSLLVPQTEDLPELDSDSNPEAAAGDDESNPVDGEE